MLLSVGSPDERRNRDLNPSREHSSTSFIPKRKWERSLSVCQAAKFSPLIPDAASVAGVASMAEGRTLPQEIPQRQKYET